MIKIGLEELGDIKIIGPGDVDDSIPESFEKIQIEEKHIAAIAHLPESLQKAIRAFTELGKFPDEDGALHEMGGYDDDYDELGCLSVLRELILAHSVDWASCKSALLFLGLSEKDATCCFGYEYDESGRKRAQ